MADVRPFRGLIFNTEIVGELADVICPPYDVISPQMQKDLYYRSPFNIVRIEEGEILPSDSSANNRYTRAAETLHQWMNTGALVRDETPAYYLVQHGFPFDGTTKLRLALIADVRLEEYEKGVVLPHEHTQRAAKEDRLALMEACQANISQIMLLYRDREGKLARLFQQTTNEVPIFSFSDSEENTFALWRITNPEKMQLISDVMSSKVLYIADGHHRYETALTYRDRQSPHRGNEDDEAHNFLMTYLVELDNPGLVVLPYHRVVGGLDSERMSQLHQRIDHLFTKETPIADPVSHLDQFLQEIESRGKEARVLGFVQARDEGASLLTLRPELEKRERGPIASFEAWILEEMVLKPVLGDSLDEHVTWVHDAREAVDHLRDGHHQAAFLLKALPMDLFETIVSRGERLPRKSTFFHPKLPTGLTINLLKGRI